MAAANLVVLLDQLIDGGGHGAVQAERGEEDVLLLGDVQGEALIQERFEVMDRDQGGGGQVHVAGFVDRGFGGEPGIFDDSIEQPVLAGEAGHRFDGDVDVCGHGWLSGLSSIVRQ